MASYGILLVLLLIFGCSNMGVSASFGATVNCSETTTIELNQTQAGYLNLNELDQVVISRQRLINTNGLDPQCIASKDNIIFILNLTDCDSYIIMDNETITYTWTIRNQPYINESVQIQRFQDYCFNVSCIFSEKHQIDFGGISPEIRKVALEAQEETGIFDVELTLYEDSGLLQELENEGAIHVPDYVYASVELVNIDSADTDLHVQIDDCWATPTSSSGDNTVYSIIENGCAASNPSDPADAINVTRNYRPRNGAFHFRSFVWTNDFGDLIYVHCNVTICDAAADGAVCDLLDCSSRRKRRDEYTRDQQMVVSGPVRVSAEKKLLACDVNNGGCSDICSEINGNVICTCYEGKSLMHDGKTCYANKLPIEIVKVESNATMTTVIVMFAVIIICGFWSMIRKRNKKVVEI